MLRSLHSPQRHFSEDPLRVFRGAVCLTNMGAAPLCRTEKYGTTDKWETVQGVQLRGAEAGSWARAVGIGGEANGGDTGWASSAEERR